MLKENASTSLDLQFCQTACKLQVTSALLQQFCHFVWLGVERLRLAERKPSTGLKMSKCGFSSLNLFWALTWSASSPRSHPKRRSTPRLHSIRTHQLVAGTSHAQANTPPPVQREHQLRASRLASGSAVVSHRTGIHDVAAQGRSKRMRPPRCTPPRPASSALSGMTSTFCTAFSRRFRGIHRLVLNLIGSRWRWDHCWRLCTCTASSSLITCQNRTAQVRT